MMAIDAPTPELEELLEQLQLERLDQDLFLGDPGKGEGRLFGGMVLAQSIMATYSTVEESTIHSLHAYFIRPGRHGVPIRFLVYRIRDGRTFTTRDVVAYQAGEAIFQASLSFTRPEPGADEHQEAMPPAPDPEDCKPWGWPGIEEANEAERDRWMRKRPITIRDAGPVEPPGDSDTPRRQVWARMRGPLPESEAVHAAAIAYASDSGLLSTARGVMAPGRRTSASLDHSVWYHHPPRFDDWLLFTSHSPIAHSARALIYGEMYTRDGTRVASVVQEGLIRPAPGGKRKP
jgi:acyl-CoA thioesterase II